MQSPQAEEIAASEPEAMLVGRAKRGDLAAFEELYRSHLRRVYGVCRRLVDTESKAEEMTQRTFVRAWTKLGSFRGASRFGTWLHRIAVNVVLSERQTRWARDVESLEARSEPAAQTCHARSASNAHESRLDLESALRALPAGARRVVVLHDIEGYTHAEIGKLLGVTDGTSRSQLWRARHLLKEILQ